MAAPSYEVAIYNADKKELVGVFKTMKICSKYIFEGVERNYHQAKLHDHVREKFYIQNTRFDFTVAIRVANAKQLERLKDDPLFIERNYPKPKSRNSYVIC